MPKVITISDDAYRKLKEIKKDRSFSKAILSLIERHSVKRYAKKDVLNWIKKVERQLGHKRKENISERVDEILYGVKK